MKWLATTALVACLVGCATPRNERLGSITVVQRHTYAICAGYCPNLDVTVRRNGHVTFSRSRFPDLQVTSAQAAQFFDIFSRYRPVLRKSGPVTCEFWNTTDPLVLKVYPYEVIWTDAGGNTFRLRSCRDPGLSEAIRQALWSIGRYMGGEPRP